MVKEYEIVFNNKFKPELKLLTVYDADNKEPVENIFEIVDGLNKGTCICESISEKAYVAAFDSEGYLIGCYLISKGDSKECSIYHKQLTIFLTLTGAQSFIVFHNHPNNAYIASKGDYSSNNAVSRIAELLDIEFIGSYIVTRKGIYSYLNHEDTWHPFKKEV